MIFWDASALVKAYREEIGTQSVLGAIKAPRQHHFLTEFVALEVFATLAKLLRDNKLPRNEYHKAVAELTRDYPSAFDVVPVDGPVRQRAFGLVETYKAVSVGPLDLLHLASAIQLRKVAPRRVIVLASADDGLLKVSKLEGLETFNPAKDPLGNLLRLLPRTR